MLSIQQKLLIKKLAAENGLKNTSISLEEGSKKGDNYLGKIFLVKVKEEHTNKKISFIVKNAETDKNVRSQMPIHDLYQREVFMYQRVLPTFQSFQEKYSVKQPFKAFAKLYGYSTDIGKEYLIMENIRASGFQMLNRRQTMNDEHISFVFKELANFHSISLAMKHVEPETYKLLTQNLQDIFLKHTEKSLEEQHIEKKIDSAIKMVEGDLKATTALINWQRDFRSALDEAGDERNHLTILHGDTWCNNMMFKYEDQIHPNKPTSMCFLDWQLSKTQSPLADLSYFLFLSASKAILDNHRKYLDLYYQTVEKNLESMGCNITSLFPSKLFEEHWRLYSKLGLIVALRNLKCVLIEDKEVKDFSEMAEGGRSIAEIWNDATGFSDEYCQRLKDIIYMLVENKYL